MGAMLETPLSKHDELGPLNRASLTDQWERLRAGDRLYYLNRLTPEEIQELPTLVDLIRDAWSEEEMKYFPDDLFAIVSGNEGGSGAILGEGGSMDLFDGDMNVRWVVRDKNRIDFTMSTLEAVSGGYIGLGWNSKAMKGAEIWFCESRNSKEFKLLEACVADAPPENPLDNTGPFTCCVADGERHVRPQCNSRKYLTVLDSCASDGGSYVTVRAQLCSSSLGGESGSDCFSHEGDLDFIVAYHPTDVNAAHGFSRRSNGATNLLLGTAATCSDDSAQAGLFALHGATLLFAWLILAPTAIYIARYFKDKVSICWR